jgi:tRNA threonylcarbamoyladenosine biosynthesis protein TsaB
MTDARHTAGKPRNHTLTTPPPASRLLAFDTSTDTMSVGVSHGPHQWLHTGPGAAQSSLTIIPTVLNLLAQAGLRLSELDAIVFGRGPGSFTGVRTACAVAQGLAAGSHRPVLPLDTLLALAEEARWQAQAQGLPSQAVSAVLDARMNEVYVQHFEDAAGGLSPLGPCQLQRPEALTYPPGGARLVAGNAFDVYPELKAPPAGSRCLHALPTAAALLRLAASRLDQAVPAAQALPLYVRDKVAQTTEERMAAKAAHAAASPAGAA